MDEKIVRTLLKVMSDKDIKEVLNTIQDDNERENTDTKASSSRSASTSTSSRRKRNNPSGERYQENGEKYNKQHRPLDVLAKLLVTDTVISVPKTKPIQSYVTEEAYLSLMEQYNKLQADYLALQQRFQLTLDCLGDIGEESDDDVENNEETLEKHKEVSVNEDSEELKAEVYDEYCDMSLEEHNGKNKGEQLEDNNEELFENNYGEPSVENIGEPLEENNEEPLEENNRIAEGEVTEEVPVQEPPQNIEEGQIEESEDIIDNLTNYVNDSQWDILKRSQTSYLFVRNVMRILFDKAAILTCTVPGEPFNRNIRSSLIPLNPKKIFVLKVLLNKYLEQRNDPKLTEIQKHEERRNFMQHVSAYVVYIKQKHREGVDVTYL